MSAVVSLAEHRIGSGGTHAWEASIACPLGLTVPLFDAGGVRLCDPATERDLRSGERWGMAARLLQKIVTAKDRVIAIDPGPGILPALAAKFGARRVLAFDTDPRHVRLIQHLFAANGIVGEALHGRVGRPDPGRPPMLLPTVRPPSHDLSLILDEERISLMLLPTDYPEIALMRHLPPLVDRVVLTSGATPAPAPAVDMMMLTLIGSGFSFDAERSVPGAMLFRRLG